MATMLRCTVSRDCRALIVHPRFLHTLAEPPLAPALLVPRPADWHSLPAEVLLLVASHLDKAQDLLNLTATCRDARYVLMMQAFACGACGTEGQGLGRPQLACMARPGFSDEDPRSA